MPTYLRRAFTSLPIILMAFIAGNEQLAAQSIFESCETDLKAYCGQVTPGNGHIVACLYAHENTLSDNCDAATEDHANLLDWFFESVRYVMDQCANDIQKHCADVTFGGGRIFSCLVEKTSSLTDGCKALVPEMSKRLN